MNDKDPYTAQSLHVISKDYVQRNLIIGSMDLSISRNKVAIYYKIEFTSAEIKRQNGGYDKYRHYFDHAFPYRANGETTIKTFYYARRPSDLNYWGTIGLVFAL